MAGLKKKRRIQFVLAAAVVMVAGVALMGYAFRDGIEFFRSPSQIAEELPQDGERFRLGGLVKEGSWQRGVPHQFVITDLEAEFPVVYEGLLPDLFSEGTGTIVTGEIQSGVFQATEVLAKHDEQYMPKEVADALKEQGVYKPEGS